MNNLLNFSLVRLVQASSGSTTNSDNQLIGTIMIGVGVVVILISVLILISRFKSGGSTSTSTETVESTSVLKPITNTPSVSPSNLPQGLPPIDQLQPKNTPTQTLPPEPTPVATTTTTTTTTAPVTTTPAPELPKTFPNVPLSELAGSTATEKSYSLEDIEKSGATPPPTPPVGV